MFDFGKYYVGLFFISKRFSNLWIVQQFFEDRIHYFLANLETNLAKHLLKSLRVLFSNDINVKVAIDHPFDNFKSNSIIFLFFPSLSSCDGVSLRSIQYILDLFFLKHGLNKISSLRPILKVVELLSFTFAVIILIGHLVNLDDSKEGKNVIFIPVHIPDLII